MPSVASDDIPVDLARRALAGSVGTLAYALDGDIYVADPDGSNAAKIADGRPPDECGGGERSGPRGRRCGRRTGRGTLALPLSLDGARLAKPNSPVAAKEFVHERGHDDLTADA